MCMSAYIRLYVNKLVKTYVYAGVKLCVYVSMLWSARTIFWPGSLFDLLLSRWKESAEGGWGGGGVLSAAAAEACSRLQQRRGRL